MTGTRAVVLGVGLTLLVSGGCDDDGSGTDAASDARADAVAADRPSDAGSAPDGGSDAPTQPGSPDAWPDTGGTDQQSVEIGSPEASTEALTGMVNPDSGEIFSDPP